MAIIALSIWNKGLGHVPLYVVLPY